MKNRFFTLTRRNQKGQVAIFVALIFQVIFVFFAILINIGLLVHHKINLQQSTDLAAYYGAMKQAEIMNAIAHVNFQMRQAWKLLTWRYRIVGTFGFQDANQGREAMVFPLHVFTAATATTFSGLAAETTKCAGTGVNILDVPFFCGGHSGFGTWRDRNENNCRVDCEHVRGVSNSIAVIPRTGGYDNSYTGGVSAAVNAALDNANTNIANLCNDLGPSGFASLAKYIIAYRAEVQNKKKLIQMLAANLSAAPNVMVDLNGGAVEAGATKTFEKNLTEANLTGKISFSAINGLTQNGSTCAFQGNDTDGQDTNGQFLTEIKFDGIQFFVHQCSGTSGSSKKFLPVSMYTDGTLQQITPSLFPSSMSAADRTNIRDAIVNTEFIVGYEKNPWCQVYYAAKAQTEPKIPFLPLSKIKLSAISVAKPFGGTIGPRYHAFWPSGNPMSSGGPKVDATLPERKFSGVPPGPPLVQYQMILPNYANYVGDTKGLKDVYVAAAYQDLMLHRQLSRSISELNISQNKENPNTAKAPSKIGLNQPPPDGWPDYGNWNDLSDPTSSNANYDYLAKSKTKGNSFLRDLEIAVIAPNQFDLNYYSIDPDFYNNYYIKIKGEAAGPVTYPGSFNNIKNAARGVGLASVDQLKPDYGYNQVLQNAGAIAKNFSVRHQIAIASEIVKASGTIADGFDRSGPDIFRFMANRPASLLTGWTFQDFSHYVDPSGNHFPSAGPDAQSTMTFGKCADPDWNNTADTSLERNFDTPVSKNLPPTPGNCVTGGRTGYSVKIVSPSLLRSGAPPQDFGGNGAVGNIMNTIDNNFFTF